MTNQEAIETLKIAMAEVEWNYPLDYAVAIETAIEALEKQIPKKPVEYEDKYYGCPICGNALMRKWEKYPTVLMPKSNGLPYCLCCGQALDWNEEPTSKRLDLMRECGKEVE